MRPSVSLSRSWNRDRDSSVRLSFEVLKPRSRSCPSVCLSICPRIFVRPSVHLSGGFCPSVCPGIVGQSVLWRGLYICRGGSRYLWFSNVFWKKKQISTSNCLEPDGSLKFFHPSKLGALFDSANFQIPGTDGSEFFKSTNPVGMQYPSPHRPFPHQGFFSFFFEQIFQVGPEH